MSSCELKTLIEALALFAARHRGSAGPEHVRAYFEAVEQRDGADAALACAKLVYEAMVERDRLELPSRPHAAREVVG